jgi:hypothetical protein
VDNSTADGLVNKDAYEVVNSKTFAELQACSTELLDILNSMVCLFLY